MECPWPIDVKTCCEKTGLEPTDPKVVRIITQVSEMMTRWSGYIYGGCRTIRPLSPCGECRTGCCMSGDCIVLHNVTSVTEVRIDGKVVDPKTYHYAGDRGLLCAVPPAKWPYVDPRYKETGALEVDVKTGAEPDAWALAVATELACELILACTNKTCRIPRNATQVTSQGVTITLDIDEIKYVIPSVGSWVSSINPVGAIRPARVYSPEVDKQRIFGERRKWWY